VKFLLSICLAKNKSSKRQCSLRNSRTFSFQAWSFQPSFAINLILRRFYNLPKSVFSLSNPSNLPISPFFAATEFHAIPLEKMLDF